MELFDMVDKDDNVIGVTDKVQAHTNGQIHRVVAVYVFDASGKLYLQVHKKSGGLYDNSVGGHVAKGESYDEATCREASEELGITQPLQHISIFYSDERNQMQHMFGLYECTANSTWHFEPNDEVEEIVLMELSDISKLIETNPEKFTGGFKNTFNKYLRIKSISF